MRCKAILKSGRKKGQQCGNNGRLVNGTHLCGRHKHYTGKNIVSNQSTNSRPPKSVIDIFTEKKYVKFYFPEFSQDREKYVQTIKNIIETNKYVQDISLHHDDTLDISPLVDPLLNNKNVVALHIYCNILHENYQDLKKLLAHPSHIKELTLNGEYFDLSIKAPFLDFDSEEEECPICCYVADMKTPCCSQNICKKCWNQSVRPELRHNCRCPFCRENFSTHSRQPINPPEAQQIFRQIVDIRNDYENFFQQLNLLANDIGV